MKYAGGRPLPEMGSKADIAVPKLPQKREWHAAPEQSHQARQDLAAHIINDATLWNQRRNTLEPLLAA
jgi:hypothetical protein